MELITSLHVVSPSELRGYDHSIAVFAARSPWPSYSPTYGESIHTTSAAPSSFQAVNELKVYASCRSHKRCKFL
jgi:hypothetical protein